MTTAQLGSLILGEAVLGSAESADAPFAANISMVLTLTGSLQLTAEFVANIAMAMTVAGGLTTLIQMAANIPMVMNMQAALRTARNAGILSTCGHPISSNCDSWLLSIFQRPE